MILSRCVPLIHSFSLSLWPAYNTSSPPVLSSEPNLISSPLFPYLGTSQLLSFHLTFTAPPFQSSRSHPALSALITLCLAASLFLCTELQFITLVSLNSLLTRAVDNVSYFTPSLFSLLADIISLIRSNIVVLIFIQRLSALLLFIESIH